MSSARFWRLVERANEAGFEVESSGGNTRHWLVPFGQGKEVCRGSVGVLERWLDARAEQESPARVREAPCTCAGCIAAARSMQHQCNDCSTCQTAREHLAHHRERAWLINQVVDVHGGSRTTWAEATYQELLDRVDGISGVQV